MDIIKENLATKGLSGRLGDEFVCGPIIDTDSPTADAAMVNFVAFCYCLKFRGQVC